MSQPDDFTYGEDWTPEDHLDPDERDPEAPPADAVEQATVVDPAKDEPAVHQGFEVAEWDAMEQARVVEMDDEYR